MIIYNYDIQLSCLTMICTVRLYLTVPHLAQTVGELYCPSITVPHLTLPVGELYCALLYIT